MCRSHNHPQTLNPLSSLQKKERKKSIKKQKSASTYCKARGLPVVIDPQVKVVIDQLFKPLLQLKMPEE